MGLSFENIKVGDLIAFQIGETKGFSSPNADRWGVIKVLHTEADDFVTFAIIDGLFATCPSALVVRFRKLLQEKRFAGMPRAFPQRGPSFFSTWMKGDLALTSARIIGHERILRRAEKAAMPSICGGRIQIPVGHISHVALKLDHEDRAINDSIAWKAEIDQYQEQSRLAREEAEKRLRTRLKGISLSVLLNESAFASWDDRPEITPPEFVTVVSEKAVQLLRDLSELGPKPGRAAVRKPLLGFVDWLNGIEESFDNPIETDEREDLMRFLEEVCWAVKQKALIEEIDERRDW